MHEAQDTRIPSPNPTRGFFITLEGIDGAGKTTQCARLCAKLEALGKHVVRLREPGGTVMGERVRALLLDPSLANVDPVCELLLYEAARAQLMAEVIRPALDRGDVVVSDRFFDSTVAYQGFGREIELELVQNANSTACGGIAPDVTLLLDFDPRHALARATAQEADRIELEGVSFQERVRAGFLHIAQTEPDRVRTVDAAGTPDDVWSRICAALAEAIDLDVSDGADRAC